MRAIELSTYFAGSAGGSVEDEVSRYLERRPEGGRGAKPASVRCFPSGALRYIRDFMPQADAANTCEVAYPDGIAESVCVVSGDGKTLMMTPGPTCEAMAASYGRGPGLMEPGELDDLLSAEQP